MSRQGLRAWGKYPSVRGGDGEYIGDSEGSKKRRADALELEKREK